MNFQDYKNHFMTNQKTNKFLTIAITLPIICSFILCCGTLGGIGGEKIFPTSKRKLQIAMDSLFIKNPQYKIPKKWESANNWSKRGYDFLENEILYFKSPPEEMYYVSYIGDSTMLADTTKTIIKIRAIYKGNYNGKWLMAKDLNSDEKQRIENRFDNEIISKLEDYTKTKILK